MVGLELTAAEIAWLKAAIEAATTPGPTVDPRAAGGFIADVASGQVIASTWGNTIRNATVQHFATMADRDLYWPAATAPDNAMCTTADNQAVWHLNTATGARRWTPPWNTAWGEVGRAVATASQIGIGAATDLTGLAVTWTSVNGRLYRVNTVCRGTQRTSASIATLQLTDGTGAALAISNNTAAVNDTFMLVIDTVRAGTGAAMTVKLQMATSPGTLDFASSPTQPAYLLVTDIGPTTPVPTARPGPDADEEAK